MRRYRYFILFLALASCIDHSDYNIKSVTGSPVVLVPLLTGELSMQDALSQTDSAFVRVDGDGLLYLDYTKLLISSALQGQIKIPDVNAGVTFHVPAVIPSHTKDLRIDSANVVVDLNLDPEKLDFIEFKSGMFVPRISPFPLDFKIFYSSTDLIHRITGTPFNATISKSDDGKISLADYDVHLDKNKFNLKIVFVLAGPAGTTNMPGGRSVTTDVSLNGMDYKYIKGFFGHHIVTPPVARLAIGAFGESLGKAHASFVDPIVSLTVYNDYSVPTDVSFTEFRAHKQSADLQGILSPSNPITINYPSPVGTTATTLVTVANSKQLIDFGPTEFIYSIAAEINRGLSTGVNALYDTSKIKVGLHIKIPFYGHVSNVTMSDTASVDLNDLKQSSVDSASLEMSLSNQLPLDAKLQFYVTDQNYVISDSLLSDTQIPLIKSAKVGSDGNVVEATVSTQSIPLNTEAVNKLFTAKYIIVKARLNTSEEAVDVKIKSANTLQLHVAIKAKMKVEVTF